MQDNVFLGKHEIFEGKLMNMLLAGEHELFAKLRKQYEVAIIEGRDFDGYGFFTDFEVPDNSTRLVYGGNFDLGDVSIDYNGQEVTYGAILFINDGLIDYLEGYPLIGHDWVNDYDKIDDMYYILESDVKSKERDIHYIKSKIRENMPSQKWEPKNGPLALNLGTKDEVSLEKHLAFEKKLMDMLLFGEDELFSRLRKQYESAKVTRRGFDDCGFITNFTVGDRSTAIFDRCFVLSDIHIGYDGLCSAYRAALFIDDGFISCLSGYPAGVCSWINDYNKVDIMYYKSGKISRERSVDYMKAKARKNTGFGV